MRTQSPYPFVQDLVLIGGDFNGLGPQLDELDIGWWDGPAASTIDDRAVFEPWHG